MCGFALAISERVTETIPDAPSTQVDAALARRGPDSTSHHREPGLVVVTTRLTHWEEGASAQPLVTDDGGLAVFNGELFNLTELQQAVGRPGASEIEVLLYGFRMEGPEFARRIDGQFAAVVRPYADTPVLAVRDRFGVCPLYLSTRGTTCVLGSSLESVTALAGGQFELDVAGIASILHDWAPTHGLTTYAGVSQVAPGTVLELRHGAAPVARTWADARAAEVTGSAADAVTPPDTPLDESPLSEADVDELAGLMRESVRARMRSTSQIVCLLSGGIDSTIIGALAHEAGARTGLALYLDGDTTVRDRQIQVADALGYDLIHHRLRPAAAVSLLEEYVRTRRVPLVRLGPVGMMSLGHRARSEGIRGVLSGEGADELFSGYDSYRILAGRAGKFGPVRSLPWEQFGDPEFGADRGPRWARTYWRAVIALSNTAGNRRSDIMKPVAQLFRPVLRSAFEHESHLPADFGLEDRRHVDLRDLLGSYLLTVQGDHAWMEEGVELRPPYLATPVARWALRRDPATFVDIANGKLPVRALLARLAVERPELAQLGFAKAAFRVDASFILREEQAAMALRRLVAQCPDDLLDAPAVMQRFDKALAAGTCSESESMVFLLAASLGVLAHV